MTEGLKNFLLAVPKPPAWEIGWDFLDRTPLQPFFQKLAQTPQNPHWHGEGDVLTHTQMVCRELSSDMDFRRLTEEKKRDSFCGRAAA